MRIKICCIKSVEEARAAHDAGAHILGLVSQTLSGPGAISDALIREIAESVPHSASTCLLTSETDSRSVADHVRATGTNAVQLVGAITPEAVGDLRCDAPGISLIKVVHVESTAAVEVASRYFEVAHALLLDTAVRGARSDSLGGTGKTHDWRISRKIVQSSPVPVYLAGGLNPENVEAATLNVRPDGVDVCSGLRRGGILDASLLSDFVAHATAAPT